MGINAQQILSQDPEYLQRQLAQQEMQRLNPQGTAAGAIGALFGRGLGNVSAGRGFFESAADPGLKRVSDVQRIMRSFEMDIENPRQYYLDVAKALQDQGYGDLAPLAIAEAAKIRTTQTEQKVVPPGAAVLDSKGNVIFQNPKETAQNIKTVDLGDRIEYYQGDSRTPFKTERKGEAPTTQFRRELEQSKKEEKESKQEVAAQSSIAHATKVLQDVSETKNLVGPLTTGGAGGLLRFLPQTDARKLGNKIQTIKANLGFDRLQQMREASPTGGALGQVAVQEINFLQSVVATLDQLESQDDILNALGKIEEHYSNWLNAVKGRMPSAQRTPTAAEVPSPSAITTPPPAATGLPAGVTVKKVK